MYTTEACWYCDAAKALLAERHVAYEEVLLARDVLGRAKLVAATRRTTFPQIVVDDRRIGGYHELVLADRAGRLAQLAARG